MSVSQILLHAFLRWLDFAGLTTLVGALAFRCLIVQPPALSRQELEVFDRHVRRVEIGSIVLVALTSLGDLISRTLIMGGETLGDLGGALPVVLSQTHYGAVWLVRIGLVGLLGLAWILGRPGMPKISWYAWASFLAATAIALTTSLSGHAADWGDFALPVPMDWLHLLAISTWAGGLFTLGFVLPASLLPPGKEEGVPGLAVIARRFSRMAGYCAVGFLVTGLYNAWLQVTSLSPLVTTSYGRTLLVKLSLVLLVLMVAALNRYYILPLLGSTSDMRGRLLVRTIGRFADTLLNGKGRGDAGRIRHQFFRLVRLEWLVVIGALACSALLTQLPPARHIRSHQHREQHTLHRPSQGPTTAKRVAGGEKARIQMNSSRFLERTQ